MKFSKLNPVSPISSSQLFQPRVTLVCSLYAITPMDPDGARGLVEGFLSYINGEDARTALKINSTTSSIVP